MKAKRLIKLLGICSCCVLLNGCIGVKAQVQNTETVLEETELPGSEGVEDTEMESDVEASSVEVASGTGAEEEQVLDQSAEIKMANVNPAAEERVLATEVAEETEIDTQAETEADSENQTEGEEAENLRKLTYQVEDQKLEIGKCFGAIVVPEYATDEDGSQVRGKVEWRKPGKDRVLDEDMELTGVAGDKRIWEWTFVPEEAGYEKVTGTAEITMQEMTAEEGGSMMEMAGLWPEKITDETSKASSSSGSSAGASNIIEASDMTEALKWMGAHMTGTNRLGGRKENTARDAGKENFTVAHGTVVHEENENQEELENRSLETEKIVEGEAETKTTAYYTAESAVKALKHVPERKNTAPEAEKNLTYTDQHEESLTCADVLEYGRAGMTVFIVSQGWYLR